MMNRPFFSIIIPTYNRASHIEAAVRSALNQKYDLFEVIVVDDGSTDDTEQVFRTIQDERLRYVRKANGERGSARNHGIRESRGSHIGFLDSDDQLHPNHLQVAATIIADSPLTNVFHLGYECKDDRGILLREYKKQGVVRNALIHGNPLSCNGVIMKRATALGNPFSEERELSGLEDWELWIRLSQSMAFPAFGQITSTVTEHKNRSVLRDDDRRIISKVNAFSRKVRQLPLQGRELRSITASVNSYGALHLAMAGARRRDTLRHLFRSLWYNPFSFFSRRMLATIRFLIFPMKEVKA